MSDEKVSKLEILKEGSRQLRGTIAEELTNGEENFSGDSAQLLKHHGTYQQDNRDMRGKKNEDGTSAGKEFSCMVRTRIPGGKVTSDQFLAELDLCDDVGNGTVRLTSRQGFQLHAVLKSDLKRTIQTINETKLTTFAACGDVERNVMCCPAPHNDNKVRQDMQDMADVIAEHLKPKTSSYFEIWLEDENGEKTNATEFQPVDEPIYGPRYLPRKFKTAIALPEDNCVDLMTQDLGFLAIVEDGEIVGYNVFVGGGQGMTPAKKTTYPTVAQKMTYVPTDQVLQVAEAIVKVQRDFGNRLDRKQARMKYLIADWGIEKFKAKVEEYFGGSLPEPHPADVTDVDDHMGWHDQGDGRWYLGINVENGRVKDEGDMRLKTGLREILKKYGMPTRLTPLQGIILCDIEDKDRADIDQIMVDHGIKAADDLSLTRRFSIACPALPTCGLSVTESERVLPQVIDDLEKVQAEHDLADERISVHMTGCPNGCCRPYTPDIGLVGKARGKYTLYLGGNAPGTRLAFLYKDMVPLEEIAATVSPILGYFKSERSNGESFGDFCARKGLDDLTAYTEAL
ncbi:MAG: NADPH-dependent assimilatory sulfite reductase hemoprotein subunit [Planctomycetaceae bacterium]|nr:NADPH-dependent assimilatory sulfite reductase hemoprotein subunit [Planctomycetaceae bacterium]